MAVVDFHESLLDLLIPIERVQQHPQNPNNGDMDAVVESILGNGFYNPAIVQKSTGYIVAGNTRYAALLSLGETLIPVVYADIDDEQAIRILIADNRTAELAVRDGRDLERLLRALDQTESGLAGTGYTADDYLELRRLNHISDNAGFGQVQQSIEYDRGLPPHVVISGLLDDDGSRLRFDSDDEVDVQVVQLRELGFDARRGGYLG
jgi:hypothetical protein